MTGNRGSSLDDTLTRRFQLIEKLFVYTAYIYIPGRYYTVSECNSTGKSGATISRCPMIGLEERGDIEMVANTQSRH